MNRLILSGCLLVTLALSSVALAWSQAARTPDLGLATPQAEASSPVRVTVPIRLFWGYLAVVEGSIGDMQGLHFLVDTGAYPSVIDLPIARSLGLAEQPRRVNLSNKSVRTRLVTLPSLRLGSVYVESLPVLTEDLSFMRNALGYKVDAIIGLDVLGKSSFTIDFQTKQMHQGAVAPMAFSAPFSTGVPIVTIQAKFQGQPLRLAVDTGAPGLLLFQSRVPGAIAFREVGRERVADVSGSFESRKVRIPSVFLGNEPIGAQIASVVDDRKDAGDNFDGILGMREPRFSSIAFDFQRGAFFWELSNHR